MSRKIDLNADIGELEGDEGRRLDAQILTVVTSCNIACGGHAGDEISIRKTLQLSKDAHVNAGVHPSYPDRENFGRKSIPMDESVLKQCLFDQVARFQAIANELAIPVSHLKPHGALYNDAAGDAALAEIVAQTALSFSIPILVGLPSSEMEKAARRCNLAFVGEGFADRAYEDDGRLRSREKEGAVIHDKDLQANQAIALSEGSVKAFSGHQLEVMVDTICLHGDTPGAFEAAKAIRHKLETAGVDIG